jgi:hypothetical protein
LPPLLQEIPYQLQTGDNNKTNKIVRMLMSLFYRLRSNGRTICSRKPTFRLSKDGTRVVLNQREKHIVLGHDRLFYLVGFLDVVATIVLSISRIMDGSSLMVHSAAGRWEQDPMKRQKPSLFFPPASAGTFLVRWMGSSSFSLSTYSTYVYRY